MPSGLSSSVGGRGRRLFPVRVHPRIDEIRCLAQPPYLVTSVFIVGLVAVLSLAAIVLRPRGLPEWVAACAGALVLVAAGALRGREAFSAAAGGWDVYLFLAGMLTMAELLRERGIFDWLASRLVAKSAGSRLGLFSALYLCGVAVTALLSNDGTILLLTPAAVLASRRAGVPILPQAFAVALVANAASFILPIANPANLLLFPSLPLLHRWLFAFGASSVIAIAVTWIALALFFRSDLAGRAPAAASLAPLDADARFTAIGVAGGIALVVGAAAAGYDVGIAAAIAAAALLALTLARDARIATRVLRGGPWSVVPLVAGLLVIVRALDGTGILTHARSFLSDLSRIHPLLGNLAAGVATAFAANALNNLPAGVMTRYALQAHGIAPHIAHAALIGIDLGPNASLTGSLATLLWLMLLRREGVRVGASEFFRCGIAITVPALALSLFAVR